MGGLGDAGVLPELRDHWNRVYGGGVAEGFGWYEPEPSTLELVTAWSRPDDAVIDIGGGESLLTGRLHRAGYRDLTVLDLSAVALERSRARLAGAAAVAWVEADVTSWDPPRTWDLWHDRAVFHFLVDDDRRRAYRTTARRALADGGRLIVATFGPDGPDRCAGLPVRRHSADELAAAFEPGFTVLAHRDLPPRPDGAGDRRPYVAVVLEPTT